MTILLGAIYTSLSMYRKVWKACAGNACSLRKRPFCEVLYGIMEKEMETTIVYWGYIGVMEKKMETTIVLSQYNPNIL